MRRKVTLYGVTVPANMVVSEARVKGPDIFDIGGGVLKRHYYRKLKTLVNAGNPDVQEEVEDALTEPNGGTRVARVTKDAVVIYNRRPQRRNRKPYSTAANV